MKNDAISQDIAADILFLGIALGLCLGALLAIMVLGMYRREVEEDLKWASRGKYPVKIRHTWFKVEGYLDGDLSPVRKVRGASDDSEERS